MYNFIENKISDIIKREPLAESLPFVKLWTKLSQRDIHENGQSLKISGRGQTASWCSAVSEKPSMIQK